MIEFELSTMKANQNMGISQVQIRQTSIFFRCSFVLIQITLLSNPLSSHPILINITNYSHQILELLHDTASIVLADDF